MVTLSTRMLTATIIGSAWPHAMAQTLSGGIVAGVSCDQRFPKPNNRQLDAGNSVYRIFFSRR